VALVIVLVSLSLVLAVTGELARAMRLEGATTSNFRASISAAHLAEAAYHRAVAEILPEALSHHLDLGGNLVFRRERLTPPRAPERLNVELGPGRFSYRISDELARLNVNRVTPDVLRRLLDELGLEPGARDTIVDSLQDWRDPNEEYRLNGAESDHYLSLPVPYRSKNGDLDAVEELIQVKGVTREILEGLPEAPGLLEHLTVAGPGAVNVNTASPTVLHALGFAVAEAQLLVAGRPYVDLAALGTQLRRGNVRVVSDTFRVEAWGELPGQGRRKLTAIVQRQAGAGGLPKVVPLVWRWGDGPPPVPGPPAPAADGPAPGGGTSSPARGSGPGRAAGPGVSGTPRLPGGGGLPGLAPPGRGSPPGGRR
jgi:type II secretory pathway component PulK